MGEEVKKRGRKPKAEKVEQSVKDYKKDLESIISAINKDKSLIDVIGRSTIKSFLNAVGVKPESTPMEAPHIDWF